MKQYENKNKLKELVEKYHTYTAVAKTINVNKKTIARWAHKFNIPSIGSQDSRKYNKSLEISNKFHIQKFVQLLYKDATTFYKRKFLKFQALDKFLSRQSDMAGQ